MAVDNTAPIIGATPTPITHPRLWAYGDATLMLTVPTGGQTVWVGGPNVTTDQGSNAGTPVPPGGTWTMDPVRQGNTPCAVVASGTQVVACFWSEL